MNCWISFPEYLNIKQCYFVSLPNGLGLGLCKTVLHFSRWQNYLHTPLSWGYSGGPYQLKPESFFLFLLNLREAVGRARLWPAQPACFIILLRWSRTNLMLKQRSPLYWDGNPIRLSLTMAGLLVLFLYLLSFLQGAQSYGHSSFSPFILLTDTLPGWICFKLCHNDGVCGFLVTTRKLDVHLSHIQYIDTVTCKGRTTVVGGHLVGYCEFWVMDWRPFGLIRQVSS